MCVIALFLMLRICFEYNRKAAFVMTVALKAFGQRGLSLDDELDTV